MGIMRPMHELDSPILASLQSRHASLALGAAGVLRYPADIAPFVGFESLEAQPDPALHPPGDTVYGLGPMPPLDAAGWSLRAYPDLAQMVCEQVQPLSGGEAIVELGEADRDDVLALTALVYPHYFRPRTMALGRYFGIRIEGRLAAIVGERMGTFAAREISAVCTHPDFLGRGHAGRLLACLGNDLLAQGLQPFLHVSHQNRRALELYLRSGWRLRRDIAFWSLQRGGGA